ncbi:MAG: metallophosphoesterase family protein, partial [Spirochaetia bacterium]
MDLLRILHCADFHIGMRFSDYSQRDALREARKTAVSRVVAAARAADCHLLTVSGDLFDRVSMNKADVSSVAASLSQFPGRAVLVLPGNHDYAGAESTLWRDFRDAASDHVHVLDEREPFHLADYEIPAVVYPAPCDAKHSAEHRVGYIADTIAAERHRHPGGHDSAEAIPEARPWRIGMAHGSIEGVSPDFDGRYFPMRREELREAGVDVWLLGHSHVSWPESLSDSPRILNPGTPEPDGFDCTHPGHAFI